MKYREARHYKYILASNESFLVPGFDDVNFQNAFINMQEGELAIKKYYAWDGSSVPLKKFIKWLWDSDRYCKKASIVHDALYQIINRKGLDDSYRLSADVYYRRQCITDGMAQWQANMRYRALRRFGSAKRSVPKPILVT